MFITGLPGSGTTWTYAVLSQLFDGGEDVHWSSGRKGGEWNPLRRYTLNMHRALLGHVEPTYAPWPIDDDKRREWLDTNPKPEHLPALVKVPDWGVCRLYEEYDHRSLLVVRPTGSWLESTRTKRRTMNGIDPTRLVAGAAAAVEKMRETADLIVEWPRALDDPDYFSEVVGVDTRKAQAAVTNPEWVSRR